MVKIEPYDFQKKTNIKEHNDMVDKINQIVDVINDTNVETIGTRLDAVDEEIRVINNTDSLQWVDIEKLKTNDSKQDTVITEHTNKISNLTDSLVSNVTIVDGYNTGTFKVRIDREGALSIDSNEYALESPTSIELIQGTGPSMFKCQITLSDGRTLVSNDFVFTTEYIGQDVYISSFTFKSGNVDGTISADIGLSSGATIEANNFAIPTPPTVASSINDLNTRVQSLEDTTVSDARITNIETKNTEQDAEIERNATDITLLQSEIESINSNFNPTVYVCNLSDCVTGGSLASDNNFVTNFSTWYVVNRVWAPTTGDFREYKSMFSTGQSSSKSLYLVSGTVDYTKIAKEAVKRSNISLNGLTTLNIQVVMVSLRASDWVVAGKLYLTCTISNGVVTSATLRTNVTSEFLVGTNSTNQKVGFFIQNIS